ncbi:MAG: hypothetical protein LBS91_07980 [Clostridiales Family XIII bacterium]|jgi:hypothetical protein|nr:hypothetical protein [Clostridiales Family XIII bacterium]
MPESADLKCERPLIIGIDGGHVRGWKSNPSFEVKCATIATGAEPVSGKRRRLADRVGHAANCSVDEFRKRISTLAIKSGYPTAEARIFVPKEMLVKIFTQKIYLGHAPHPNLIVVYQIKMLYYFTYPYFI